MASTSYEAIKSSEKEESEQSNVLKIDKKKVLHWKCDEKYPINEDVSVVHFTISEDEDMEKISTEFKANNYPNVVALVFEWINREDFHEELHIKFHEQLEDYENESIIFIQHFFTNSKESTFFRLYKGQSPKVVEVGIKENPNLRILIRQRCILIDVNFYKIINYSREFLKKTEKFDLYNGDYVSELIISLFLYNEGFQRFLFHPDHIEKLLKGKLVAKILEHPQIEMFLQKIDPDYLTLFSKYSTQFCKNVSLNVWSYLVDKYEKKRVYYYFGVINLQKLEENYYDIISTRTSESFAKMLANFHGNIKNGIFDEVKKFVDEFPFFKICKYQELSAIEVSLKHKQLVIYAFLRSRNFICANEENFQKELLELSSDEKDEIRKYLQEFQSFKSSLNFGTFHPKIKSHLELRQYYHSLQGIFTDIKNKEELRPFLNYLIDADWEIYFDIKKVPSEVDNIEHNLIIIEYDFTNFNVKEFRKIVLNSIVHFVMNDIFGNNGLPYDKEDVAMKEKWENITEEYPSEAKSQDLYLQALYAYLENDKDLHDSKVIDFYKNEILPLIILNSKFEKIARKCRFRSTITEKFIKEIKIILKFLHQQKYLDLMIDVIANYTSIIFDFDYDEKMLQSTKYFLDLPEFGPDLIYVKIKCEQHERSSYLAYEIVKNALEIITRNINVSKYFGEMVIENKINLIANQFKNQQEIEENDETFGKFLTVLKISDGNKIRELNRKYKLMELIKDSSISVNEENFPIKLNEITQQKVTFIQSNVPRVLLRNFFNQVADEEVFTDTDNLFVDLSFTQFDSIIDTLKDVLLSETLKRVFIWTTNVNFKVCRHVLGMFNETTAQIFVIGHDNLKENDLKCVFKGLVTSNISISWSDFSNESKEFILHNVINYLGHYVELNDIIKSPEHKNNLPYFIFESICNGRSDIEIKSEINNIPNILVEREFRIKDDYFDLPTAHYSDCFSFKSVTVEELLKTTEKTKVVILSETIRAERINALSCIVNKLKVQKYIEHYPLSENEKPADIFECIISKYEDEKKKEMFNFCAKNGDTVIILDSVTNFESCKSSIENFYNKEGNENQLWIVTNDKIAQEIEEIFSHLSINTVKPFPKRKTELTDNNVDSFFEKGNTKRDFNYYCVLKTYFAVTNPDWEKIYANNNITTEIKSADVFNKVIAMFVCEFLETEKEFVISNAEFAKMYSKILRNKNFIFLRGMIDDCFSNKGSINEICLTDLGKTFKTELSEINCFGTCYSMFNLSTITIKILNQTDSVQNMLKGLWNVLEYTLPYKFDEILEANVKKLIETALEKDSDQKKMLIAHILRKCKKNYQSIIDWIKDTYGEILEDENFKTFVSKIPQSNKDVMIEKCKTPDNLKTKEVADIESMIEHIYSHEDVSCIFNAVANTDTTICFVKNAVNNNNGTITNGSYSRFLNEITVANSSNDADFYGVFVHESSHCAFHVVYNNGCKPYFEHDLERKKKFLQIKNNYEVRCHISTPEITEPIITTVFQLYKKERHEAELAVRYPQLVAKLSKENHQNDYSVYEYGLNDNIVSYHKAYVVNDFNSATIPVISFNSFNSTVLTSEINIWDKALSGNLCFEQNNKINSFIRSVNEERLKITSQFPELVLRHIFDALSEYYKSESLNEKSQQEKENFKNDKAYNELVKLKSQAIFVDMQQLKRDKIFRDYFNNLKGTEKVKYLIIYNCTEWPDIENELYLGRFKKIIFIYPKALTSVHRSYDFQYSWMGVPTSALIVLTESCRENILNQIVCFQGKRETLKKLLKSDLITEKHLNLLNKTHFEDDIIKVNELKKFLIYLNTTCFLKSKLNHFKIDSILKHLRANIVFVTDKNDSATKRSETMQQINNELIKSNIDNRWILHLNEVKLKNIVSYQNFEELLRKTISSEFELMFYDNFYNHEKIILIDLDLNLCPNIELLLIDFVKNPTFNRIFIACSNTHEIKIIGGADLKDTDTIFSLT